MVTSYATTPSVIGVLSYDNEANNLPLALTKEFAVRPSTSVLLNVGVPDAPKEFIVIVVSPTVICPCVPLEISI